MAPETSSIVSNSIIAVILVVLYALFTALDLGMLSIDPFILQDMAQNGTPREKKQARMLKPLLEDEHLLIIVILFGCAICSEILPIVLEPIIGAVATVLVTTVVCVLVCEILPEAIVYRNKIGICIVLTPLLWLVIFCTFVLSYPLARALDCLLGKEELEKYSKKELAKMIELHGQQSELQRRESLLTGDFNASRRLSINPADLKTIEGKLQRANKSAEQQGEKLSRDEVMMIQGILELNTATVKTEMRTLDDMFMINIQEDITPDVFSKIRDLGYSRIPVFLKQRQNVAGFLLTKQLIKYDNSAVIPIKDVEICETMMKVPENTTLLDILQQFRIGNGHLAAVISDQTYQVIGFISLEDVLEKLINEQIYDEKEFARISQQKQTA